MLKNSIQWLDNQQQKERSQQSLPPSHGGKACERSSISRFYDNCKKKIPSKKGYPRFKKNCRCVEYKTCGWKLSLDRKKITFSDKNNIGSLKLKGTYDLNFYQLEQIKRVKIVKRADGYYVQFSISVDVVIQSQPTFHTVGLDLGLKYFLADSGSNVEESPQFYRKSESQLKRANRKKSKKFDKERKKNKQPQSARYVKARNRYARKHLRVSRQRKEYCKRLAYSVIQSNDLVAYVGEALPKARLKD